MKPVSVTHVTPHKRSVSTNTPSSPSTIPHSHIQTRRSVINHPLHLTQDDSNIRKFDLETQSPRICHTPPLQVQGESSFFSNFGNIDRTRSVTPDSELSSSINRVNNWLDNHTQISALNLHIHTDDIVESLPSLQHNVPSGISAQVNDEFTADRSPINNPSRTQTRSVVNPESVGYHVTRSTSSYVSIPAPFSQIKTIIIRDIPSKSSKPSTSGKKSHK